MKNYKQFLLVLLLSTLATFISCNSNKKLKEEKAKKAGEYIIALTSVQNKFLTN
jgi:hypothetical protein